MATSPAVSLESWLTQVITTQSPSIKKNLPNSKGLHILPFNLHIPWAMGLFIPLHRWRSQGSVAINELPKVPCWSRAAPTVKSGAYDSHRPCSTANLPYHPWEIQGWWGAGSIPLLCSCRNPQNTHCLAWEKAVCPAVPFISLCGPEGPGTREKAPDVCLASVGQRREWRQGVLATYPGIRWRAGTACTDSSSRRRRLTVKETIREEE